MKRCAFWSTTLCAFVLGTSLASLERPMVFRIDENLRAPYARGFALGEQVKANFPDIEAHYDAILTRVSQDKARVETLRETLSAAQQEEVKGVADALDLVSQDMAGDGFLSFEEFWGVQFLGDLAPFGGGIAFGLDATQGQTMIARTLDSKLAELMAGLSAVTVLAYPDREIALVGFAGMVTAQTGMNADGLAMTMIDGPDAEPVRSAASRSAAFSMRTALENDATVKRAASRFALNDFGRGLNIMIADSTHLKVLERPRSGAASLRSSASETRTEMQWPSRQSIAATSCFSGPTTRVDCRDFSDQINWARLRDTATDLQVSAQGMKLSAFGEQIENSRAVAPGAQLAVLGPGTGEMFLKAAGNGQALQRVGVVLAKHIDPVQDMRRRTSWIAAWLVAAVALAVFARFVPGGRRSRMRRRNSPLLDAQRFKSVRPR